MNLTAVRRATFDDVAALAAFEASMWQEHTGQQRDSAWVEWDADNLRHTMETLDVVIWIGEVSGVVVGVAWSCAHNSDDPRRLELLTTDVLDEYSDSPLRQTLLDAAIGSAPAFLWADDVDAQALEFYRRNGFVADGHSRSYEPDSATVSLRMVR